MDIRIGLNEFIVLNIATVGLPYTLQWPCVFSKRTFVFFSNVPKFFFAARSLPTQARTFFRTYLTFGKNRSRSLLLAEQDVDPNSFVADLKVVTNARDIV